MSYLADLSVLVVDCQATGATPEHGAPIELAWGVCRADPTEPTRVQSALLALPVGASLPRRVADLTGIRAADLRDAPSASEVWARLATDATAVALPDDTVPVVAHFAHFERRFMLALQAEHAAAAQPFEVICSYQIARRLFPDLPGKSLRAVAGFLGTSVGEHRRAAPHAEATAAIWRAIVPRLAALHGVQTWDGLRDWLATFKAPKRAAKARYPFTPAQRRALPDHPGVYRFLGGDGQVLYVGKAMSLKKRVQSHFHDRSSGGARAGAGRRRRRELLSQVHGVDVTETPSALEAALLETDEIKRLAPAYNTALRGKAEGVWFATRDFTSAASAPDANHVVGPLPTARAHAVIAACRALISDAPFEETVGVAALGVPARWAPDDRSLQAGLAAFLAGRGLVRRPARPLRALMCAGAALWREARRPDDDDDDATDDPTDGWTPERVERQLGRSLMNATRLVRRAGWLCRLTDARLTWRPRGSDDQARSLFIANGAVVARGGPGGPAELEDRSLPARQRAIDVPTYDRLRVLTTELRRVVAEDPLATLQLGAGRPLTARALAIRLAWL